MMRISLGKVILSGLIVTFFAKAALSLPEPEIPTETAAPREDFTRLAAGTSEIVTDAAPEIKPIVSSAPEQCETPEEVLQSFAVERRLISDQKEQLDLRESELVLAREKLDLERRALQELKDTVVGLLRQIEASQTEDLYKLISFYENMKPAEAAQIMNDLDIEVTVLVLATMKPRVAAPILARMSPVRARAVSKIILERSQLPGDQDLQGIRLN